jgi:hypothetical protein
MTSSTSSSSGRRRFSPDQPVGSGVGEGAPQAPVGPTTSERIAETQALIARLEGELAASREVEQRSRAQRAEHALAAAEGSASAQKALSEASHAAAMAVLDSENLELAIGSARERLASLEAEAEAERLQTVKQGAVQLARERRDLAGQLESALATLNELFVAWRNRGQEIAGLRDGNPRLYLPHQTESVRPFLMALPDEFRADLKSAPSWVHPTDRRSIADADPATAILRDAGELAPLPPDPPSLAEMVLAELNGEAAKQRSATDNPHVSLETGRSLMSDGVIPQHAAQDALLAGFRVVGRTANGGAITEKVRGPDPSPAVAPEPAEAA